MHHVQNWVLLLHIHPSSKLPYLCGGYCYFSYLLVLQLWHPQLLTLTHPIYPIACQILFLSPHFLSSNSLSVLTLPHHLSSDSHHQWSRPLQWPPNWNPCLKSQISTQVPKWFFWSADVTNITPLLKLRWIPLVSDINGWFLKTFTTYLSKLIMHFFLPFWISKVQQHFPFFCSFTHMVLHLCLFNFTSQNPSHFKTQLRHYLLPGLSNC